MSRRLRAFEDILFRNHTGLLEIWNDKHYGFFSEIDVSKIPVENVGIVPFFSRLVENHKYLKVIAKLGTSCICSGSSGSFKTKE